MTALTERKQQLPDNIEDLSRFVLVVREKLNAVRAEIRAINKIGLAKEVHEQKLVEAQEIAEAVLDAEVRLGELTAQMEKVSGGDRRSENFKKDSAVHFEKAQGARTELKDTAVPKSKKLEEIGITEKQKQRYESLAKHPEAVQKAKAKARKEGRIVTRQDVTDEVVKTMPRGQSVKEFIRETEKEHEEFLESKKQGVVSIDAAKAEKRREEVIANETELKILAATKAVGKLVFVNGFDIDLIVKVDGKKEAKDLIDSLIIAEKTLAMVRKRLEEKC